MALFALRLPGQTALEFFTNRANELLQPEFGFGVANIPVYSSTNPAIAYSASLHYLLQSAANAYDATTPAANSPSVFRPLFSWSSNALFIVGYTNVTTDFYEQTGRGFKTTTDPTISSNDNIWGIPWVVGMKNNPPAFNEYCYSTAVLAERELLFVRTVINGQPQTNLPPRYTNQLFFLSISNVFGLEAWNFVRSSFPDGVTIVASNQVSITLTNNYNWGTNYVFDCTTNWIVDSWPGWTGSTGDGSFLVPLFTNVISLPVSYWSDSTGQFVSVSSMINAFNNFLPSDLTQKGWPEHDWMLNITNNLMYALIDNRTGQVLDFVNLGGFGSSIPITQALADQQNPLSETNFGYLWATNGATDEPNSPMSTGILDQIAVGEGNRAFAAALNGLTSGLLDQIFSDPYVVISQIVRNYTWQAVNPLVHYTLQDLAPINDGEINFGNLVLSLDSQVSNSICSLGRVNVDYNSGTVENLEFGLTAGMVQLNFFGLNDLPYTIWVSTDLLDWSQLGIASQICPEPCTLPYPRPFQFNDPATTNYAARFYQIRLP